MKVFEWKIRKAKAISKKKKLLISFACDDLNYRDHIMRQSWAHAYEIVEIPPKKNTSKQAWQTQCSNLINKCDGAIVLIGPTTHLAEKARNEIRLIHRSNLPVIGIEINQAHAAQVPRELRDVFVMRWNWDRFEGFVHMI
ncbi:MAG: hypothetical protein KDD41_02235 [Flavobacteriales bacterium]|nr:hypothetical protein [Flavobacteriales bacterium]